LHAILSPEVPPIYHILPIFFWGIVCKSNKHDSEMHLHQNGRLDKKLGIQFEEGFHRHAPAAMRVTHTLTKPGAVGPIYRHSIRCSIVLFRGPRPKRTYQNGTAAAPLCTLPHPCPPNPPCHPSIHLKCNFQIFSTTPSAVPIAFGPSCWTPPVACQKLHFRLRLWLRLRVV